MKKDKLSVKTVLLLVVLFGATIANVIIMIIVFLNR
jgi:hypothetical protein